MGLVMRLLHGQLQYTDVSSIPSTLRMVSPFLRVGARFYNGYIILFTPFAHADGAYLYVAPLASRHLWRVPTSFLKVQPSSDNPYAILLAKQAVESLGEMPSHADGLETDSMGYIYSGAPGVFSTRTY